VLGILALAGLCVPALASAQPAPTAAALLAATQMAPPARPAGACATLSDAVPADAMDAALADAWKLLEADSYAAGLTCFEHVLAAADRQSLPPRRAEALLGAGQALRQLGRYDEAKARHERALPLFRELGDRAGEARGQRNLGLDAYYLGKQPEAQTALFAAKALFEEIGDHKGRALVYNNLMYVIDAGPEKDRLREEALTAAREGGEAKTECGILHEWGDEFYSKGWYADAKDKLTEALHCYERTPDLAGTGTVLVSMGRMSRVHGRPDLAMVYYHRALELQERSGDTLATVQTLNAMAISLSLLGHMDESLVRYNEALTRARAVGSDQVAAFLEGQIGGHYLAAGDVDRAIPLLESSLKRDPRHVMHRERQLAEAYARTGRKAEALPLGDHAVELARVIGTTELLGALMSRENVHYYNGQLKEAEADLTEAFAIIDEQRTRLVPTDFMKRGFVAVTQDAYSISIDLLQRSGRTLDALERAEEARGRAFIDLLASRSATGAAPNSGTGADTDTKNDSGKKPDTTVARAGTAALPQTGRRTLTSRGSGGNSPGTGDATGDGTNARSGRGAGGSGAGRLTSEIEAELTSNAVASHEVVAAPTLADVRATARRLGSTLLVYWVGREQMSIWVV
jgi:tetratricopeptide (TPR) repeat protein